MRKSPKVEQINNKKLQSLVPTTLRKLTSWWLNQPIWKIWVKMGSSSPIFGVKIKKYLTCHHPVDESPTYQQRPTRIILKSHSHFGREPHVATLNFSKSNNWGPCDCDHAFWQKGATTKKSIQQMVNWWWFNDGGQSHKKLTAIFQGLYYNSIPQWPTFLREKMARGFRPDSHPTIWAIFFKNSKPELFGDFWESFWSNHPPCKVTNRREKVVVICKK